MALVIPPGFGNAAFIFTGPVGTQPYVTTIGLDISEYGGDHVAVANKVKEDFALVFATEMTSQLTLDRVTLAVGQDGPGGSVDSDTPPNTFSRSGQFPPTAMSLIARKVTNDLGRRGRGRMFIPGIISENEVDQDGTVVAARRNAVNALLADFYDQLTGAGGVVTPTDPVLLHGSAPTTPTPITGLVASDLVGWIRGRIR